MNNAIENFSIRLNQAKERICELDDRSRDIIRSEELTNENLMEFEAQRKDKERQDEEEVTE